MLNARAAGGLLPAALLLLTGLAGSRPAAAQRDQIVVPAHTVVRVRLDDPLSSRESQPGDRFMVTVTPDDRSGFPVGTRFEGVIIDAQHATHNHPGILGARFRRVIFPNGHSMALDGHVIGLTDRDVAAGPGGRLVARGGYPGSPDWKWAGIGAGSGAVLGAALGGSWWRGLIVGGIGGTIFGLLHPHRDFHDVHLQPGTRFGIVLTGDVGFPADASFRFDRGPAPDRDRDYDRGEEAPERQPDRGGRRIDVELNGRPVDFPDERPITLNGHVYVPLRPIAEAARMRFEHADGAANFTFYGPDGTVRGIAGEAPTTESGPSDQPILVDGEVYVPPSFLDRNARMHVRWDDQGRRLTLETD